MKRWYFYVTGSVKNATYISQPKLLFPFQINPQLDATISPVYYPDVYLQLNMFQASSRPSSGAQQLQQQPLVLTSERGDNSALGHGQASM